MRKNRETHHSDGPISSRSRGTLRLREEAEKIQHCEVLSFEKDASSSQSALNDKPCGCSQHKVDPKSNVAGFNEPWATKGDTVYDRTEDDGAKCERESRKPNAL